VFDAHELFTEMPELIDRQFVRYIWRKIEQWLLPRIKYSYTVCQSIADIYYATYGIEMKVVRNLPLKQTRIDPVALYPGLPKTDFVIYQGSVNKGRGLETLVDAFEDIEELKCVIIGDGDLFEIIKTRVITKKLSEKVLMIGKLPFKDLEQCTPFASLGISIEENLGQNYYYALPNKLFDYIQAGVPVLVSDFPEMSQVINTYCVGETLVSRMPNELAKQIQWMVQKHKNGLCQQNLAKAADELCWENEEKRLLEVYEKLL
jgi:glycosyltransferase involved in cell wall biosynthesis